MRTRAFGPLLISLLVLSTEIAFPSGGWMSGKQLASSDVTEPAQSSRKGQGGKASSGVSPLTVYVASPLGFAESTRTFMEKELIPTIQKTGINTINPWDPNKECDAKLETAHKQTDLDKRRLAWVEAVKCLGAKNAASIEKADGVVAVLDGVDVDSGTAAEIGYATALGKWVIGYRGDFRRTGEDVGADVNLQVEYFILKNGGTIAHTLSDLDKALRGKMMTRR